MATYTRNCYEYVRNVVTICKNLTYAINDIEIKNNEQMKLKHETHEQKIQKK